MPFLEKWVEERYSPQAVMKRIQQQAPNWLEQLPQLPEAVLENLQGQRGRQQRDAQNTLREREGQLTRERRERRRYGAALLCLGAAGACVPVVRETVLQAPPLGWVFIAIAAWLALPSSGSRESP